MTYSEHNGSYLIRFMPNEEVVAGLLQFCQEHNLTGGFLSGLGASKEVEFGSFNVATKQYINHTKQKVEVANLTGNIAVGKLHIHVTVADSTGQAFAGHLLRCITDPTIEIMITPFPETHRKRDDYSGLNLLDTTAVKKYTT